MIEKRQKIAQNNGN